MNCAVLEHGQSLLIIACGVTFPDGDVAGIDQIAPDFAPLVARADDIEAVVITHGHADHIGALGLLLSEVDVPVVAPPYASALIQSYLREYDLDDEVDIDVVRAGDTRQLGPFDVEFVHVNHSIPQTVALAIDTGEGVVVHTADFKLDARPFGEPPADIERLRALGDAGVRMLLSDSTNIQRPGRAGSELDVAARLGEVIAAAVGRVFVTLFSTNVFRVQALVDAAEATGRKLVLLGRSLQRNVQLARDLELLRLPSTLILDAEDAVGLPAAEILVACTGSQGQSRAALARIAWDSLAGFQLEPGDAVLFSARAIPGNEQAIARMKDQVIRRGAAVIDAGDVHCSGHARSDEQREMLELIRPRTFVPVHGDHRFLCAHADLARELGITDVHVLDSGDVLEVDGERVSVVDRFEARRVGVDGTPLGHVDGWAVRMRRRMAERGVCVVVMTIDATSGEIEGAAQVSNLGLFDDGWVRPDLMDDAREAAAAAYYDVAPARRFDEERVAEDVRVAVMRVLRRETRRKPLVVPFVFYV